MSDERTYLRFHERLLPERYSRDSYRRALVVHKAIHGLPLDDDERRFYVEELSGGVPPPTEPVSEGWLIIGRRDGKTELAGREVVYRATCVEYDLSPGEIGVAMLVCPDRRQGRVAKGYISAMLHASPVLERLIANETKTAIELTNGIRIEIVTASHRTIRGYSVVTAVLDEVAFFPTGDAAEPDKEILAALRPAMATVSNSLLLCISSPYARKGALWEAYKKHYGKDTPVMALQAPSGTLNPSDRLQEVIDQALEEDEASARAEYLAEFRRDIESYVDLDVLEAAVVPGRRELPYVGKLEYRAFTDPSGGGADSFALAVGHVEDRDGQPVAVVDALRERKPPFSPEDVVKEYAELLKSYGVSTVVGDRYAGEWPREAFRRHGISYEPAAKPKSDLYIDALAALNSGRIELPDHDRLQAQLHGLERRTSRGGRDSVDHGPGGHDDLANVVAGIAVTVVGTRSSGATWGRRRGQRRASDVSDMQTHKANTDAPDDREVIGEKVSYDRVLGRTVKPVYRSKRDSLPDPRKVAIAQRIARSVLPEPAASRFIRAQIQKVRARAKRRADHYPTEDE